MPEFQSKKLSIYYEKPRRVDFSTGEKSDSKTSSLRNNKNIL